MQEWHHHLGMPKDRKVTQRGGKSHGVRGDRALTIAPNHLEVGVLLLDVVYHGNLIHRVPLG